MITKIRNTQLGLMAGSLVLFCLVFGVYHAVNHHLWDKSITAHTEAVNRGNLWAEIVGDKPFTDDNLGAFARDVQPEYKSITGAQDTQPGTYDTQNYGNLTYDVNWYIWTNPNDRSTLNASTRQTLIALHNAPVGGPLRVAYENQAPHFPIRHLRNAQFHITWLVWWLLAFGFIGFWAELSDIKDYGYKSVLRDPDVKDHRIWLACNPWVLMPLLYWKAKDMQMPRKIRKADAANPVGAELQRARAIAEEAEKERRAHPTVPEVIKTANLANEVVRRLAEYPQTIEADKARIRAVNRVKALQDIKTTLEIQQASHKELMAEYHEPDIQETFPEPPPDNRRRNPYRDDNGIQIKGIKYT